MKARLGLVAAVLVLLFTPCASAQSVFPDLPYINPPGVYGWVASTSGEYIYTNSQAALDNVLATNKAGTCGGACEVSAITWQPANIHHGPQWEITVWSHMWQANFYGGIVAPLCIPGMSCATTEPPNAFPPPLTPYDFDPRKSLGPCDCDPKVTSPDVGNPIRVSTGNKSQVETDITGIGLIEFKRYYNSAAYAPTDLLGTQWTHSYTRKINDQSTKLVVTRPGGAQYSFVQIGSLWLSDPDIPAKIQRLTDAAGAFIGWSYTEHDSREIETYDTKGRLTTILRADGTSVTLVYNNGVIENSGNDYQLTKVTAQDGRSLTLSYGSGRIYSITDGAGVVITYTYDSAGRLTYVNYPGGIRKRYVYNEDAHNSGRTFPFAMTGIVDESNIRFASFTYGTDGRAIVTQHGSGIEKYTVTYNADGSATVLTPSTSTEVRSFATVQNVKRMSGLSESTTQGSRSRSFTYDVNGRIDQAINALGVVDDYDYSARGLLTQLIENSANTGGTRRKTQTDWHATFDVPLEKRVYDASNAMVSRRTWAYNEFGQVIAACAIDPANESVASYICGSLTNAPAGIRQTSWTYCAGFCQVGARFPVRTIDGPRTDVNDTVTYTYRSEDDSACVASPTTCAYRKGDLWKITDALGNVTEVLRYDGRGRTLSVKNSNGIVTDREFDQRGRLTAVKVRGTNDASETDDAVSTFEYWPTGLVRKTTQPDGAFLYFGYDDAHRLINIADGAGNSIHYVLDNASNRISEQTTDNDGNIKRSLTRVFNQLGQLTTSADAYSNPTDIGYDEEGNVQTVTDALGRVVESDYDALNRLSTTIQDSAGVGSTTRYQFDARNNLVRVVDPKVLNTEYIFNGLGDLTSQTSPDTGATNYTYDNAGNRLTKQDARNITVSYSYDAENRLVSTAYPATSLNIVNSYDTTNAACVTGETFAVGRLSKQTMGDGNRTEYCYDRFGNLVREVNTINSKAFTLLYAYNKAGRITSTTYPDGAIVDYVRDSLGRVIEVGVTPLLSTRQVLVTGVTYHALGPVKQWTFGNGRVFQRGLNQNYQQSTIYDGATGGLSIGYTYDAVGNLSQLRDASQSGAPQTTFSYDPLNRLTDFVDGPSGAVIEHYTYDATGDRINFTGGGGTQTYTYDAISHHLMSKDSVGRTYDAIGNTLSVGGAALQFNYDDAGRMDAVKKGGSVVMNYAYNGKGERVHRYLNTTGTDQVYTVFDEGGQVAGEYDDVGAVRQQVIWLNNLPIGVLTGAGKLYYVEADALGSPRAIIDPLRNLGVWSWSMKGEAFGNSTPNEDPDEDGASFVFDLRFPGQRFDAVSGLNQNGFRDYDSSSGRYLESDPMGLGGGISTYAYVNSAPLTLTDPLGLQVTSRDAYCISHPYECAILAGVGAAGATAIPKTDISSSTSAEPRLTERCKTCGEAYPQYDECSEIARYYPYASAAHAMLDFPQGSKPRPGVPATGGGVRSTGHASSNSV